MPRGIRYRVAESDDGQFYYATLGGNGETMNASETYPTAYGAHRALRDLWEGTAAHFARGDSHELPAVPYSDDSLLPAPRG